MERQPSFKRLSCKRCQMRKIRCDRKLRCSNCVHSSSKCEYRTQDARRRPVSHSYVAALESRVAWYESLVKKLKCASAEDRDGLLDDVVLDDHLGGQETAADADSTDDASAAAQVSALPVGSLKRGTSGTLQYHGPTSIYLDEGPEESGRPESRSGLGGGPMGNLVNVHSWSDLRLASALGIDEALVNEALALFFCHQYPQFMFVYREAFLADYFASEHGGRYWSFSLVYALSALGAAHAPGATTRSKAQVLARCAEEIVLTHELCQPTYTTVQALLCLAFHELGQGSSSKGWMLSGMAFRMGQDLGFQRDPKNWARRDRLMLTGVDLEIRRRIYWGCYLADKFISLHLGRPPCLIERDAEVEPVEPLPDLPDNDPWFGLADLAVEIARTRGSLRPQLTVGLRYMVVLGEIFQDIMAVIFSPKVSADRASALNHVDQFNIRLNRWQSSLPEGMQWSQWMPKREPMDQSILILHLFYHSIAMSLNRHFIDSSRGQRFPPYEQSQSVCAVSCDRVIAMTRQFRRQWSVEKIPLLLLNALVTVAITIATASGRENGRHDARIHFIIKVLADCSPHFRLAAEMRSQLVRYFNCASMAVHEDDEVDAGGGSLADPVQTQRQPDDGADGADITLPPADVLASVAGGPQEGGGWEPAAATVAAPELASLDYAAAFPEGDPYNAFMPVGFQEWFTEN